MKITILIYFRALAGYAIYFEFCRNEPASLVTNDKIGKLHFVMLLHIKLIGFIGPQSIWKFVWQPAICLNIKLYHQYSQKHQNVSFISKIQTKIWKRYKVIFDLSFIKLDSVFGYFF